MSGMDWYTERNIYVNEWNWQTMPVVKLVKQHWDEYHQSRDQIFLIDTGVPDAPLKRCMAGGIFDLLRKMPDEQLKICMLFHPGLTAFTATILKVREERHESNSRS